MEMENPTHGFREKSLVLQHIQKSQTKSKNMMSWRSRKNKEGILCTVSFVRRKFFKHFAFILMYSVLNTLSVYTYFYISKNISS